MPDFQHQINSAQPTAADIKNRRWIYIPYDRYTDRTGPLTDQHSADTGIVIVESTAKALRRPYHKKKLIVLISNMRHFALEQQAKGVSVLYHFSPHSHGQALLELQRKRHLPPLTCMTPAERELRLDLATASKQGLQLQLVEDTTWASTTQDFLNTYGPFKPGKPYVMDRFYRRMRQQTGILMQNAKPIGGQFSFDASNRNPYKNQVAVPTPPVFAPTQSPKKSSTSSSPPTATTSASQKTSTSPAPNPTAISSGISSSTISSPTSAASKTPCATTTSNSSTPKHPSCSTSAVCSRFRTDPRRSSRAANDAVPLASAEGFIRQLLGWREFMRHLHEQTDGYRLLAHHIPQEKHQRPQETSPDQTPTAAKAYQPEETPIDPYAGATPSALHASLPLPAVYWGVKSGLHCMDTVVAQVIAEGWSHHITRLMVLSNLATLCGFSPRELTDWFWFAYVDAYDWVVEPNVLGMATYADGGLTATKPYVSGAAYINRMSNFCAHCQYDPKKSTGENSCPFTALYWTFLERNEATLSKNFRMQMPYNTLRKKSPQELVQLRTRAQQAVDSLQSFKRPTYEKRIAIKRTAKETPDQP